MSELLSIHHFGFGSPLYLLALLSVPLLVLFAVVVRRRRSPSAVLFTNVDLLAGLTARRPSGWRRRAPLIVLALALSMTAAALARPRVQLTSSDRSATIVLLVDVSGSMDAADITPSRLFAAVTAMHDFLNKLPAGDRVGLVSFSNTVEVLDLPTTDYATVNSGLDVLSSEAGTALGDGVAVAVKTIVASLAVAGVHTKAGENLPAAIVLESDGAQNRGTITPQTAGYLAKAAGIPIYGVALGTRYGQIASGTGLIGGTIPVPPDPGTVAELARESGGQSFSATTAEGLNTIYRRLGSSIGRRDATREITSWFESIAALLLLCGVGVARAWGALLP